MNNRHVTVSIFSIPDWFVASVESLFGARYLVHVQQDFSDALNLKYSRFEKALFDIARISPLKDLPLPWPEVEGSLIKRGAWVGNVALDEDQLQLFFPDYYRSGVRTG